MLTTAEHAYQRRREIADLVAAGSTIDQAAARFHVSQSQVYNACREHGVKAGQNVAGRTLRIIADLLHTDLTKVAIAHKHGISDRRVSVIAAQAVAAGILGERRAVALRTEPETHRFPLASVPVPEPQAMP